MDDKLKAVRDAQLAKIAREHVLINEAVTKPFLDGNFRLNISTADLASATDSHIAALMLGKGPEVLSQVLPRYRK